MKRRADSQEKFKFIDGTVVISFEAKTQNLQGSFQGEKYGESNLKYRGKLSVPFIYKISRIITSM